MEKRNKKIIVASWVSLIGNALLSVLKILFGFIASSLAVIGDGIDSSVDVVMSIVTLVAATIIARPPDAKYAYGYGKADSIAAKMLSCFIFFAGAQLAYSSFKRFFNEELISTPGTAAIIVIIISVLGKLFLSIYQYKAGKKTNSSMLLANAKNMKYDIGISLTVLVSLFAVRIFHYPVIDPIAALIVSVWVIKGAYDIFMETNTDLMDGVSDPQVYSRIFSAVSEVKEAKNPHRVRSRQIGKLYMIVIDIEVEGNKTITEAHDIANEVENKIKEKVENIFDIVVHIEPEGNVEDDEKNGITMYDVNKNKNK